MSQQVVSGAQLMCTFGVAPATLVVLPEARVMVEGRPAATIMDNKPVVNIPTFGMCSSPANPQVAAATAAAAGVLTPVPCMPVTAAPWVTGAVNVLVGHVPALNNTSFCLCNWAGQITVTMAGSMKTMVP